MDISTHMYKAGSHAALCALKLATILPPPGRLKFLSGTHLDHGLHPEHWKFLQEVAETHPGGPLIKTFQLPEHLPHTMSGLHGPSVGDAAIHEAETFGLQRGARAWQDRGVDRAMRPSRELSLVAVPEFRPGEDPTGYVAFTAHGGPLAPQHPLDPGNKDVAASQKFWAEHALTGTRPAV